MSNTSFNKLTKKFSFFFKRISWKETLTFLFFLILASIFWGMQIYSEKIVIGLTIPIKYSNAADDILFENKLPNKIDLTVKDYGSSILKYIIRKQDSLEIDLSSIINESRSQKTLQGQGYEQLIRSKLVPSSELMSYNPSSISYAYNRVAVKKVPVIFDGYMNLSAGYQLDGDISIYPDSVIAYGTRATLDTLHFAYTTKDTLENIKENQKIDVHLSDVSEVNFRPNKIEVNIPIDKFLAKEVKVAIECLNLPENLRIKFFPPEVTIPFFVGLKRYNLVESSSFKIQVDYKDINQMQSSVIPIRVIESPDFVRTKLPEPSEVEFILEQE